MDVNLTEEQHALVKTARAWLQEKFPIERIAAVADAPPTADPTLWRELAEMGWVGLSAPEDAGGGGATLIEEALLAEECGRSLLPAPLFGTAVALPALAVAQDRSLLRAVVSGRRSIALAHAEPGGPLLLDAPARRCVADEQGRLTGLKIEVVDLPVVTDTVVTVAGRTGPELWAVRVRDAGIDTRSTVDGTRPIGHLTLAGTPAVLLATGEKATEALAQMRLRELVLLAAECVGAGQRCVELAVEHAKQREQFGRPIAGYQAIAFPLADAHAQLDWARSLTYWAAWAVTGDAAQAGRAASAAKVAAADAAVFAAERAIQTFGGLGMTWDAPLHRWYKRALTATTLAGSADLHRDLIAEGLIDHA